MLWNAVRGGLAILAVLWLAAVNVPAANSPAADLTAAEMASPRPMTAAALFEQRILPILQSPKPSSCVECHLSGVDLKDYLRPSQGETFAALRDAGLVDLIHPDQSKILVFIARQPEKASLISQQMRKQEYAAFQAWLGAAVRDSQLQSATASKLPIGPAVPVEVIRHTRIDHVQDSFVENLWSEFNRCAACHSPEKNQQQVRKHGPQMSWIVPRDPAATFQTLLAAKLIDAKQPEKSLLLLKPTLQVEHGGGQKMLRGDRSYKQFLRFLNDYAASVNGTYRTAANLPAPASEVSYVSDIWLKLTDVPAEYDGKRLQVDLFRETEQADRNDEQKRDPAAKSGGLNRNDWSTERWATSDRAVAGTEKLWQHSLSLTAPRSSFRAAQLGANALPPGRYLLRISVDQNNKLANDPQAELGTADRVAEVEVNSRWPAGYGRMTVVPFPATARP